MENQKSMLEVATEIITNANKGVKFNKLWEEVCTKLNISDEEANKKIALFYTQLTTSGSIVQESGNVWNLAKNVSYVKSHINIEDSEEEDVEEDLDEDEKAYNASIEQGSENRQEENIDGQTEDEEEKPEQENKLSDFIK